MKLSSPEFANSLQPTSKLPAMQAIATYFLCFSILSGELIGHAHCLGGVVLG